MYQPTEQELLEMGFDNHTTYWHLRVGDHVIWYTLSQYCEDYSRTQWTTGGGDKAIYPRSKEHLEQIILAFKPGPMPSEEELIKSGYTFRDGHWYYWKTGKRYNYIDYNNGHRDTNPRDHDFNMKNSQFSYLTLLIWVIIGKLFFLPYSLGWFTCLVAITIHIIQVIYFEYKENKK